MKEIKVKIDYEESNFVEMLFFEYNQEMKILSYLTAKENTKKEYLDSYLEEAIKKGTELELAKEKFKEKYRPCPMEKLLSYWYNFVDNEIVFRVKDDE